jgi:hypothetical protein
LGPALVSHRIRHAPSLRKVPVTRTFTLSAYRIAAVVAKARRSTHGTPSLMTITVFSAPSRKLDAASGQRMIRIPGAAAPIVDMPKVVTLVPATMT